MKKVLVLLVLVALVAAMFTGCSESRSNRIQAFRDDPDVLFEEEIYFFNGKEAGRITKLGDYCVYEADCEEAYMLFLVNQMYAIEIISTNVYYANHHTHYVVTYKQLEI